MIGERKKSQTEMTCRQSGTLMQKVESAQISKLVTNKPNDGSGRCCGRRNSRGYSRVNLELPEPSSVTEYKESKDVWMGWSLPHFHLTLCHKWWLLLPLMHEGNKFTTDSRNLNFVSKSEITDILRAHYRHSRLQTITCTLFFEIKDSIRPATRSSFSMLIRKVPAVYIIAYIYF